MTTGPLPDLLESEARTRHYVDGTLVTARRGINWPAGTTVTDDDVNERVDLSGLGGAPAVGYMTGGPFFIEDSQDCTVVAVGGGMIDGTTYLGAPRNGLYLCNLTAEFSVIEPAVSYVVQALAGGASTFSDAGSVGLRVGTLSGDSQDHVILNMTDLSFIDDIEGNSAIIPSFGGFGGPPAASIEITSVLFKVVEMVGVDVSALTFS